MSDKTKRRLTIAGAVVICIALVVAIGMRFAKEPVRRRSALRRWLLIYKIRQTKKRW